MSYINIWIHAVWSTKRRYPFLVKDVRPQVFQHIKLNAKQKGIHLDHINGYTDHVHALISMDAQQCIADIMNLIKGESSFWINKQKLISQNFEWTKEYYASSVSPDNLPSVRAYIRNQEAHHQIISFKDECDKLLIEFMKYKDQE